jgi:quercetin dioxygenase-like cupin family protein
MTKVTDAGGTVLGEPMDIPGVGSYVSFVDPEGNRVSLLQPLPRGSGAGGRGTYVFEARYPMRRSLLLVSMMLLAAPLAGQVTSGDAVKWGPAPPFFPAGAKFAVLQGDPGSAGEYTVRLSMPAGYIIAPHWHPTDEHVTVISGTMLLGMGDEVDRATATRLTTDGFISAPAKAHHFAVAVAPTVVQVHGMGPFEITYVRPADDPRTAKP